MQAAMSAPSAHNEQPWHFILITDKALLKTASVLSPHMAMLPSAAAAILVCADKDLEKSPGLWSMDCAAASQNILLAAHSSGLGAVWTAIYPRQDRIDGFKAAFNLPLSVIPFAMIPLGYPAETPAKQDRFKAERIHFDKW